MVERTEIFDEGRFGASIVEARAEQRVLLDVERPGRLPLELDLDAPRVLTPGAKLAAEGVQDQHALWLAARNRDGLGGSRGPGQHARGEQQAETEHCGRD
nr:hypothetical protein [Bradyrhizobium japonicum]